MSTPHKKIFLSHSSADAALATKVRDLLVIGCGVSPNDILVSSLPGSGIPAGTPSFVDYLKANVQNAEIVVLLLSENFFASQYCLCELGATWALGKVYFPLVVPPLSKSDLGSTLEVAQAGEINNGRYIDQLPDCIRNTVGTYVGTDAWGLQRDVFLNGLDELIKSLPGPKVVSAEKLKEAHDKYKGAIANIGEKDKEAAVLKQRIADLEGCKDKDAVIEVARKYSTAEEQFEGLCRSAKARLNKLQHATKIELFWDLRGESFIPDDKEDWEAVTAAKAVEEVAIGVLPNTGQECCMLNTDHPRVQAAQAALKELDGFLNDCKDAEFTSRFEQEYEFPASLGNRDFWHKFLAHV